jgi:purine nucleosidase
MRRFLIDTDTASDDAVALVMALMHPDVQVEAVTVVGGNVPVDQGVKNALYTVELTGKGVPVYRGMATPLMRPLETAQNVHGQDGLGDIGLPLEGRQPADGHGVDVLIDVINRHAGEITLVSLGPLTNLAMAILRDPSIAGKVKEYVMMGGTGDGLGNVTPVAEYNIWVDPEAARIVWESGLPITMVGWDISRKYAVFNADDQRGLRSAGTPLAEFCVDIQGTLDQYALQTTKLEGFDLPDPIAMAVALDGTVATHTEHLYVTVDTESELSRGQTVVDHLGVTGRPPNTNVVLEASRQRFLDLLKSSVSTGTGG